MLWETSGAKESRVYEVRDFSERQQQNGFGILVKRVLSHRCRKVKAVSSVLGRLSMVSFDQQWVHGLKCLSYEQAGVQLRLSVEIHEEETLSVESRSLHECYGQH